MASNYQSNLLREFGLTNTEIKELEVFPSDPAANPTRDFFFLRNTTFKTGVILTHRQDSRYTGFERLCPNCMANFCFNSSELEFMAFYNSHGESHETIMKNEPVLDNEKFLCGFTPQSGHLYEFVGDELQKYSVVDVTKNN
jgi:hypothetical protein